MALKLELDSTNGYEHLTLRFALLNKSTSGASYGYAVALSLPPLPSFVPSFLPFLPPFLPSLSSVYWGWLVEGLLDTPFAAAEARDPKMGTKPIYG